MRIVKVSRGERHQARRIEMSAMKSTQHTCFTCGKVIKGQMVYVVPTRLAAAVCGAFEKAYHPNCHKRAEEEAARELQDLQSGQSHPGL